MTTPLLVPPAAVRVWRGFRQPTTKLDDFYKQLGTVFVPATVLMQIDAGLHAYAPTIPAGLPGKPDGVPDETAVLFWPSAQTYWDGFTRLAVRTYTMTHAGVYVTQNNQSRADFPVPFAGQLAIDQPVYLFDRPADWMRGAVAHFVAARPAKLDAATFATTAAKVLAAIKETVPLDGAIACIGADYVVYWELAPLVWQPPSGIPLLQAALTEWSQRFIAAPTFLPISLWDAWSGMDVRAGSSFNMQFTRQGER